MAEKMPDCSKWSVWVGAEIEGFLDRGYPTLFIRKVFDPFDSIEDAKLLERHSRIWFCYEFIQNAGVTEWRIIDLALEKGKTVCLEVRMDTFVPESIQDRAALYLKINPNLKLKAFKDHICVGQPFSDQSFLFGTGVRAHPEEYAQDVKIK